MSQRRAWFVIGWLITGLLVLPSTVHAQGAVLAAVTGIVQDSSGGVLPGVTVEVSSPVLIEKVRSAVTDSTGRYRLNNLPAGTYTLTAAVSGFNTVRREGLELSGSFTATVNLSLQVGTLEETLTVTGEAPVVDVSSAQRQQVINSEVMASIPASRSYEGLAALVPGIQLATTNQNVGGIQGPVPPYFTGHGGSSFEGRLRIDGMTTGGSTGGVSLMALDTSNAAEVTVSLTGGLADAENGGASINIVPRSGGNTMSGTLFLMGAGDGMQSNNFTQELKDAGLRSPSKLDKVWDVNFSTGGPIMRDKLWFFGTIRSMGSFLSISDTFYNKNAGNPNPAFWFYDPDLSRPVLNDQKWLDESLRLTWQATPRNKFTVFWNEQQQNRGQEGGGSPTTSPEASEGTKVPAVRVYQAVWTAPVSSRVLVEAAFSGLGALYSREKPGNNKDVPFIMEQTGPITFGSHEWRPTVSWTPRARAHLAYVTGSHGVKVGFDHYMNHAVRTWETNNLNLRYRVQDRIPNQITMYASGHSEDATVRGGAFYGQDEWTVDRFTFQGGLRFDYGSSSVPEQQEGPSRWFPTPIVFPAQKLVTGYRDLSLRGGLAWDVFGTGKTSLKVSGGKYIETVQWDGIYIDANPMRAQIGGGSPPIVTRSWNDRNGDYVPQCDFLNSQANGECGTMSNVNFGKVQTPSNTYDPNIMGGWGIRPRHYQLNISAQQEVLPRVSAEVGYSHRWFPELYRPPGMTDFTTTTTDNRAVTPADYDFFSITAPSDPRLPGGGNYVISDLTNISNAAFGKTDNFITLPRHYGDSTNYWQGVDVNVSARTAMGLVLQGGTSTGRRVLDACELIIDDPSRRNCAVEYPFLTDIRGLASYVVPRIDVQVATTWQSRPGPEILATWAVPNSVIQPSLGRPLSGGVANVNVNLLNPGQMYGDRINQLDLRFGKILRFGRTRTIVGVDIYNITNSSVTLTYNNTYGTTWLRPTAFMPARWVKITGQLDF
jgi:carboxypeptidase family protein